MGTGQVTWRGRQAISSWLRAIPWATLAGSGQPCVTLRWSSLAMPRFCGLVLSIGVRWARQVRAQPLTKQHP